EHRPLLSRPVGRGGRNVLRPLLDAGRLDLASDFLREPFGERIHGRDAREALRSVVLLEDLDLGVNRLELPFEQVELSGEDDARADRKTILDAAVDVEPLRPNVAASV